LSIFTYSKGIFRILGITALHGRGQLVLCKVRLSPETSETPILTILAVPNSTKFQSKTAVDKTEEVGIITGPHEVYDCGFET